MSANKTQPTGADVAGFLARVEPAARRDDGRALDRLFREVTGWGPRLWGSGIVGYGAYHYRYDSGREGDFLATGFAPRKANLVLYIMPGYEDYRDILADLGKHRLGKSCLYINKLAEVDTAVLKRLIRRGLDDLGARWLVRAD